MEIEIPDNNLVFSFFFPFGVYISKEVGGRGIVRVVESLWNIERCLIGGLPRISGWRLDGKKGKEGA